MNQNTARVTLLLIVCLFVAPAYGWGPDAQLAIVDAALNLITREQNIQLNVLRDHARAGAGISPVVMEALFPDMQPDPLRAIETEIALLTVVRTVRIDGYFAWRLGALGKLVSRVTAPLVTEEPALRAQYYSDAEKAINRIMIKNEPRRAITSISQLERIMLEANSGNSLIASEYRNGVGFRGAASAQLSADISRSINAVADVWYTILSSSTTPGNISESQLRNYVINAYAYFIENGNYAELDVLDSSYPKLVSYSADMNAKIGDLLYAARQFQRAIKAYESAVLNDPSRRDIVAKIADYYYQQAEEALKNNQLEEAMKGFEKALSVNLLHPTAERRRLEVAELIRKRDEQQAFYQEQLKQAEELRQLAEEEALKNRFSEAVVLLRQSEEVLKTVGDEFPSEAQRRARGLREVQARMGELQQQLLSNTMAFSGAGFARDTDTLVLEKMEGMDIEILQTVIQVNFEEMLKRVESQMRPVVTLK